MERPLIKFGYDGDWVIRAKPGTADRSRHPSSEYTDSQFTGKFVPAPIDCKPWVDGQRGGWDLFFSLDCVFMITDVERGLFSCPAEMTGKIGVFGPFHLGVYSGVRIKTSPGWVTLIDRVADPKVRDSLSFTTETAILETDWYPWFKNFVVIRPMLSRFTPMDVVTIERGTPLCRIRVVPRQELVACEEFSAEDYEELKKAEAEYTQTELSMNAQQRFRAAGPTQVFYPLYKIRSAELRMKWSAAGPTRASEGATAEGAERAVQAELESESGEPEKA